MGLGSNKLAVLIRNQTAVGSDQVCYNQVGLTSNPESTGPFRMEVGKSSSLIDQRPSMPVAQVSVKSNVANEDSVVNHSSMMAESLDGCETSTG